MRVIVAEIMQNRSAKLEALRVEGRYWSRTSNEGQAARTLMPSPPPGTIYMWEKNQPPFG